TQHYFELLAETQIDLYRGDARAALARVERTWPALDAALLLRLQCLRVEVTHLRARARIAVAAGTAPRAYRRRRLLAAARRDAQRIEAEPCLWAPPLAASIHAGVAALEGDDAAAADRLDSAARGFDRLHMALHAVAARYWRGSLRGGDGGRE